MIHRLLTLPATAWEGRARPPKTMIGGNGWIAPHPLDDGSTSVGCYVTPNLSAVVITEKILQTT